MRPGRERTNRGGTNQQLDALGHYIPECIEGTVSDGKSIVGMRFEGALINTGEGDARHWFKVFRLRRGRLGRTGWRQTDYILLLLTNKVIHSYHNFLFHYPTRCPR